MIGTDHGFYLALAYGVSAFLLVAEVLALCRLCRRSRALERRP